MILRWYFQFRVYQDILEVFQTVLRYLGIFAKAIIFHHQKST